jgi:hypothetical protein
MMKFILGALAAGLALSGVHAVSYASEELGAKLANPVSSMTSVPIQYNYDQGYDPWDGERHYINLQPVVPFELGNGDTLVVRTILPIVADQADIGMPPNGGPGSSIGGLGDTLQSFFYVPPAIDTDYGALTIGVGPAMTWASSTNARLGLGTWGLGPTGVVLLQTPTSAGTLTYGVLAGHQWGVSETRDMVPDLDSTFFQPFLALSTAEGWTFSANIEGGYNWTAEEASLPLNLQVAKLVDVGGQKVQLQLGGRYWLDSPDNGPEDWGLRFSATFLFPE